jgi:hypothetical protein
LNDDSKLEGKIGPVDPASGTFRNWNSARLDSEVGFSAED